MIERHRIYGDLVTGIGKLILVTGKPLGKLAERGKAAVLIGIRFPEKRVLFRGRMMHITVHLIHGGNDRAGGHVGSLTYGILYTEY
jgi:hypothetical protein